MAHSKVNSLGQSNISCSSVIQDSTGVSRSRRNSSFVSLESSKSGTQCGKSIPVRGLMSSQRIRPLTIQNLTSAGSFSLQSMRTSGVPLLTNHHRADWDSVSSRNISHTADETKTPSHCSGSKATRSGEAKEQTSTSVPPAAHHPHHHRRHCHDRIVAAPREAEPTASSRVCLPAMSRYTSLTTSMYATHDSVSKAATGASHTLTPQHNRRSSHSLSHPRSGSTDGGAANGLGDKDADSSGAAHRRRPSHHRHSMHDDLRDGATTQKESSLSVSKSCGTQTNSHYHPHAPPDATRRRPEQLTSSPFVVAAPPAATSVFCYAPTSVVDTLSHVIIGSQYDVATPAMPDARRYSRGTATGRRDSAAEAPSSTARRAGHATGDADLCASALYSPFQSPFGQTAAVSSLSRHADHADSPLAMKRRTLSPLTHTPPPSSHPSVGISTANEDDSADQTTSVTAATTTTSSVNSDNGNDNDHEEEGEGEEREEKWYSEGEGSNNKSKISSATHDCRKRREANSVSDVAEGEAKGRRGRSEDEASAEYDVKGESGSGAQETPVAQRCVRGATQQQQQQPRTEEADASLYPASQALSVSAVPHAGVDHGHEAAEELPAVDGGHGPKALYGSFALVSSLTPDVPQGDRKSHKHRPVRYIMISKELYTVSPLVSHSYAA